MPDSHRPAWWHDAKHPVWTIVHTVVATGCFTLALTATASNFDATELKAIGGGGALSGALLYLVKRVQGSG